MKQHESSNVERLAGCSITLLKIGFAILLFDLVLYLLIRVLEAI